jgi:hypothetical protein
MSRAQWLAFGSIALASCSGSLASAPAEPGGDGEHDSGAAGPDVAAAQAVRPADGGPSLDGGAAAETAPTPTDDAQALLSDGAIVGCATRSGYFECSGQVCDRSIHACYENQCVWYGRLTSMADAAATCGPCPTCGCVALQSYCTCKEDSAGTITVSCGGCYGSPPTRLERLA